MEGFIWIAGAAAANRIPFRTTRQIGSSGTYQIASKSSIMRSARILFSKYTVPSRHDPVCRACRQQAWRGRATRAKN